MQDDGDLPKIDWGRVLCVIILIVLSLVMIFGLSR